MTRRSAIRRPSVVVRFSPDSPLLADVDEIAKQEDRSRSEIIRKLLSEAVMARKGNQK